MKGRKVKTSVALSTGARRKLARVAKERDRSRSWLLERLIELKLDELPEGNGPNPPKARANV